MKLFASKLAVPWLLAIVIAPWGQNVMTVAEAPSNDVCATAAPLTIGAPHQIVNLFEAVPGETSVPNPCAPGGNWGATKGVWYTFAGTGGRVAIPACLPGYNYPYINVFAGASCGTTTLSCVAHRAQGCPWQTTMFDTVAGSTYYIAYSSSAATSVANSNVAVSLVNAAVPSNDVCTGATPLTVGGPRAVGNITFAASDETQVLNSDGCSGTTILKDVPGLWYSFQGTGGYIWPTTCFEDSIPTDISIYKGACGPTALQCVAGAMWPCRDKERMSFKTEIGVTYYVLVRSNAGTVSRIFHLSILEASLPSNDVCSTASPLAIGSIAKGNVSFASSDETEVQGEQNCVGNDVGYISGRPGLWYRFQGTGARVTMNTCVSGSLGTYISVYKGGCGAAALECVAGTYDSCALQKFMFDTVAGTTYYVLVRTRSVSPEPTSTFDLIMREVTVPANDVCSTASPVALGSVTKGNIAFARSDESEVQGEQNCVGNDVGYISGRPGLWYSLQGTGRNVTMNTCVSGSLGTYISVYKGGCGAAALECVAGTYDSCALQKFMFNTVAGTTYYSLVRTRSVSPESTSTFDLIIRDVTAPTSPAALPVSSPTTAPIALPKTAPSAALAPFPVAAPTSFPLAVPTSAPATAPVAAPMVAVSTSSPVRAPMSSPVAAPVTSPVAAPALAPVVVAPKTAPAAATGAAPMSPFAAPAAAPTLAPVAAPKAPVVAPVAAPKAPAAGPTASSLKCTALGLINASNDTKVVDLVSNGTSVLLKDFPGMSTPLFNVNASCAGAESVAYLYSGTLYRVDAAAPWSFCGNNRGDFFKCDKLACGAHTVTAVPYPLAGRQGVGGSAFTVTFTVVCPTEAPFAPPKAPVTSPVEAPKAVPTVTLSPIAAPASSSTSLKISGLSLIDANKDVKVTELTITVIPLPADMSSPAFNVNASYTGEVESVVYFYNGARFRLDDVAPFAMCVNKRNDFRACRRLTCATHTVTAIPYSRDGGSGEEGLPYTVTFTISCPPVPAPKAPSAPAPATAPKAY